MTRWHTGPLQRTGAERYLHLVRANDDPDRIGADRDKKRGWNARGARAPLCAHSVAYVAQQLRQHLADRRPRTFHRIVVELYDRSADVAFGTQVDQALWWLVEQCELEHTAGAPVRFRLAHAHSSPIGVAGLPINPARPRWCAPGPDDGDCDRCRTRDVPDHDTILCPHDACYWSLRLCDGCGGYDQTRSLQAQHLDQCAFSAAEPDQVWDQASGRFVTNRQLAMF